jgi:hypothetical protein
MEPGRSGSAAWRAAHALAFAFALAGAVACGGVAPPTPASSGGVPAYERPLGPPAQPLVIMGDTQRTSLFEWAVLGREVNDRETEMLVRSLVHVAPSALILVGDLVFDGSDRADWDGFDALMTPVRNARIAVLAAVGNHEWFGRDRPALAALGERFSSLRARTWYATRQADLGLVFVDSNADAMGREAWETQLEWLRGTLGGLERDPSIRGVLLFAHHPPFTRSVVVSGDEAVRDGVLAAARDSTKAMAIFSGHAHGYERYDVDGLQLVVCAGGGGPRPDRLRDQPPGGGLRDLVTLPAPRPLHYIVASRGLEGLAVRVMGLQRGDATVGEVDRFMIPWP